MHEIISYQLNLSEILYSFHKFENFSILFILYLNLELRKSLSVHERMNRC
jgi:hypothetical protein